MNVVAQDPTVEELSEEITYGEMELLALLVFAEAGNQGIDGMRLVADVVLNRWDDPRFGDTLEEIIFADGQFGPTVDGALERSGWNITEEAFQAVEMEWFAEREDRLNSGILYFNTTWDNGKNPFQYGDHWFSY